MANRLARRAVHASQPQRRALHGSLPHPFLGCFMRYGVEALNEFCEEMMTCFPARAITSAA